MSPEKIKEIFNYLSQIKKNISLIEKLINQERKSPLFPVSQPDSRDINMVIAYFSVINPHYDRLFMNKTQREAVARLIHKHGKEKIKKIIEFIKKNFDDRFLPRITTPVQLENKLAQLIAYAQSKNKNKITIV